MRAYSLLAATFCLLATASGARAAVCSASYQAEGYKVSPWIDLGDGPAKNCKAKAKNKFGNLKASDLGVPPAKICADGPIPVLTFLKTDPKEKPDAPDSTVKTALGVDCGNAKQNICHGDSDCEECLHAGGTWDLKAKSCKGAAVKPAKKSAAAAN